MSLRLYFFQCFIPFYRYQQIWLTTLDCPYCKYYGRPKSCLAPFWHGWHSEPTVHYCKYNSAKQVGKLTHCGPVTSYGDIGLSQHWLRKWLVAWWHQAITWPNVDLSSIGFCGILQSAIYMNWSNQQLEKFVAKLYFSNYPQTSQGPIG